jgi:hypothetical protein
MNKIIYKKETVFCQRRYKYGGGKNIYTLIKTKSPTAHDRRAITKTFDTDSDRIIVFIFIKSEYHHLSEPEHPEKQHTD